MKGSVIAGRYVLLRPLGTGGMGSVWVARQDPLGREVALKLLKPQRAGSEDVHERFRREAAAVAAIDSPHVVTVYDFGVDDDGTPYFAMERVDGPSLREVLRAGRLPEADACALIVAIARGLSAVHRQGLVHRDLKPANVVLPGGDPARAKLLDFGLAKRAELGPDDATMHSLTEEGVVVGTPGYIAPEFALKGVSRDPRSDLYALGVIAYECVTGSRLFEADTPMAVVLAHATAPRPAIAVGAASPGYAAATHQLLAINPDDRPPSADEVIARIEQLGALALSATSATEDDLPQLPSSLASAAAAQAEMRPLPDDDQGSSDPTPTLTAVGSPADGDQRPAPAMTTPAPASSRRLALAGAAAVVLAVIGGLVWTARVASLAEATTTSTREAEQPVAGGHLRVGMVRLTGPWSLVERAASLQGSVLRSLLLDRLTFLGAGHQVQSVVFDRMAMSDNADRLTLSLAKERRFGAHPRCFPEGRAVTLDDVEASLHARRDALKALGTDIDHVERLDDRTLAVVLARPHNAALWSLHAVPLVAKEFFEGECEDHQRLLTPVGTGPYRLLPGNHAQRIDLQVRDRDHPNAPHYLDRLSFVAFKGQQSCWQALRDGAVDLCHAAIAHRSAFDDVLSAPWDHPPPGVYPIRIQHAGRYALMYLLPADREGALGTPAVRRALSALLNRSALCEAEHHQEPLVTVLPPFMIVLPSPPPLMATDAAQALLQKTLTTADGTVRPLTISSANPEGLASRVCAQLTDAGVPCTLVRAPNVTALFGAGASPIDAISVSIVDLLTDPLQRTTTYVALAEQRGLSFPALSAQLQTALSARSVREQNEAAQQAFQQLDGSLPLIPLCAVSGGNLGDTFMASAAVRGIVDPQQESTILTDPVRQLIRLSQDTWLAPPPVAP